MSDASVGKITLEVESVANNSTKGLDDLSRSLSQLKSVTKGGIGLNSVASGLSQIGQALAGISNSSSNKISNLAIGLSRLSNVKTMSKANANNIKTLVGAVNILRAGNITAFKTMANACSGFANLQNVKLSASTVKNLERLAWLGKSIIGVDFTSLKELTNSLQPLQGINGKLSVPNPNKIKNSNTGSNMASDVAGLNLMGRLYAIKNAMVPVLNTVKGFVKSSTEYVEDLSLFTASLGKYTAEAKNYADTVSEVLGIDPAVWMRTQGVFQTLAEGFGIASDKAIIMSKNLTQLGYDISSFFNLSVEDSMLKLESGLAGELEPLRRIGYDLSVARLQQEAYNLGITKSVQKMTQAEKAQLRYYAIMTQVTVSHGDMARTLEAPANQLRILEAQLRMCARAIGNVFIPMLNAILPYAIAVFKVLRLVADGVAGLFGFKLPEIDYSGLNKSLSANVGDVSTGLDDASNGADSLGDNLGRATRKAKELKNAVLGIDELNIISKPEDTGGGSGGGKSKKKQDIDTGNFNVPLPQYDFLGDAVKSRMDGIFETIKNKLGLIKGLLGGIATGFAAFKLLKFIDSFDKLGKIAKEFTFSQKLSRFAGTMLAIGGAVLYFYSMFKMAKEGINWNNALTMIAGIASVMVGLWLAIKPYNSVKAVIASNIAGLAMSIGMLYMSIKDIGKGGMNIQNVTTLLTGTAIAMTSLWMISKKLKSVWLEKFALPSSGIFLGVTILMTSLLDIINKGPKAVNVLGLIAGAVIAVSSAWLILKTTNPEIGILLGIASAVGALVSVFSMHRKAIKEAGEQAYKSSDAYKVLHESIDTGKAIIDRSTQALNNLNNGISKIKDATANVVIGQRLINDIFKVNDNANATKDQLAEMAKKVKIVNGLGLDGIKLEFDDATGRIKQTRSEVQGLLDDLLMNAYNQALTGLIQDSFKAMIQAQDDLAEAQDRLTDARKREWDILEKMSKVRYGSKDYEALNKELEDTHTAIDTLTDSMSKSNEVVNTSSDKIQRYTDKIITSKDQLPDLRQEVGLTSDAMASSFGNIIPTNIGKSLDKLDVFKTEFLNKATQPILNSIEPVGNSSKGVHDALINNLISGGKGVPFSDEYRREVESTISGGNFALNSGMGPTRNTARNLGSQIPQGLNEGIKPQSMYSFTSNAIGGVENVIKRRAGDVREAGQNLGRNISSGFQTQASYSSFYERGQDIFNGLRNGIKSAFNTAVEIGSKLAGGIMGAFTFKTEINSPSRVFYRYGKYIVQGLTNGITNNMSNSIDTVEGWAGKVVDAFSVDSNAVVADFNRDFTTQVQANHTVKDEGFNSHMEDFFTNYMEPILKSIDDNTRKQADKHEQTNVYVGNKIVTDVVEEQARSNGYRFVS